MPRAAPHHRVLLGEKTQQRQALRSEFDAALKAVQPPPDGDVEMLEELSGSQISRKVKGPRGEDILATPEYGPVHSTQ